MLRQKTCEVPFGITAIVSPPDCSRCLQPAAAAHSRKTPQDHRIPSRSRSERDLSFTFFPRMNGFQLPEPLRVSAKHCLLHLAWAVAEILHHHADGPPIIRRHRANRPVRPDHEPIGAEAVERDVKIRTELRG